MLVLTRKKQERIRIGDGITVTVLRIKGKTVRLGIEAPNHCNILRGELADSASSDTPAGVAAVDTSPTAGRANEIASRQQAPIRSAGASKQAPFSKDVNSPGQAATRLRSLQAPGHRQPCGPGRGIDGVHQSVQAEFGAPRGCSAGADGRSCDRPVRRSEIGHR